MDEEWAGKSTAIDAPEMLPTMTASGMLNPYSCLPCRGRKKKCDRIVSIVLSLVFSKPDLFEPVWKKMLLSLMIAVSCCQAPVLSPFAI